MNQTFERALLFLAERERVVKKDYSGGAYRCLTKIEAQHPSHQAIDERTLEELLKAHPERGEVTAWRTWLWLPAPRKGEFRIPIMNVIYDYRRQPAEVRMQVALFFLEQEDAYATGWRFEAPEGEPRPSTSPTADSHAGGPSSPPNAETGATVSTADDGPNSSNGHAYYHVQPAASLRSESVGDWLLPRADERTPTGMPTFPLDAEDEVDLLICLLVSIYGLTEATQLVSDSGVPELRTRLGALRTVRAGRSLTWVA